MCNAAINPIQSQNGMAVIGNATLQTFTLLFYNILFILFYYLLLKCYVSARSATGFIGT